MYNSNCSCCFLFCSVVNTGDKGSGVKENGNKDENNNSPKTTDRVRLLNLYIVQSSAFIITPFSCQCCRQSCLWSTTLPAWLGTSRLQHKILSLFKFVFVIAIIWQSQPLIAHIFVFDLYQSSHWWHNQLLPLPTSKLVSTLNVLKSFVHKWYYLLNIYIYIFII